MIHPGDVVKGDRDGVVIVRRSEVQSAIDACQEREAAESSYIERYKNGETPIEVSNLAAILQAKGLTVDR